MSVPDIVPDPPPMPPTATPDESGHESRVCELATSDLLDDYLHRHLPPETMTAVRTHLDVCERCWRVWNRHRWDAAAHHLLLSQLAEFLGPRFRPYHDSSKALAAEWGSAEPRTDAEVADFFRTSMSYLFNLTIWEASGNRPPYVTAALPTLEQHAVRTILDVGCGIGSDALALRHKGFTVTGCDYRSPSTRFMHHRTGGSIPVIEPDELHAMTTPDALWIIDTLDHITEIDQTLGTLLPSIRLMITEDLTGTRKHGNQRFHHRRQYGELTELFGVYGLTSIGSDGICQYWRANPEF